MCLHVPVLALCIADARPFSRADCAVFLAKVLRQLLSEHAERATSDRELQPFYRCAQSHATQDPLLYPGLSPHTVSLPLFGRCATVLCPRPTRCLPHLNACSIDATRTICSATGFAVPLPLLMRLLSLLPLLPLLLCHCVLCPRPTRCLPHLNACPSPTMLMLLTCICSVRRSRSVLLLVCCRS